MHNKLLEAIRKDMDSHVGQWIRVRTNEGRKRVMVKRGILERTYPSIFVIRLEDENGRTMTWSYADILTDAVKVEFDPKPIPANG